MKGIYENIAIVLPLLGAVANVFIAGLALNRFTSLKKSITNITFAIFSGFIAIWSVNSALFFVDNTTLSDSLQLKIHVLTQAAIATYFFVFSFFFPVYSKFTPTVVRKIVLSQILIGLFVIFLVTDGEVFVSLGSILDTNTSSITRIIFSLGYVGILAVFFYSGSIRMHNKIKYTGPVLQKTGERIHNGRRSSILISLITSIILPLFGVYDLVWIGPISTFAYLIPLFKDITKYRLFDVRNMVTRSFLYGVVILTVATLYSTGVAHIIGWVELANDQTMIQIVFVLSSIAVGLSFQYIRMGLRNFFDKVLLRQRINPADSLEKLSDVLLREIETQKILDQSLEIIADTLDPKTLSLTVFTRDRAYKSSSQGYQQEAQETTIAQLIKHEDVVVVAEITNTVLKQELLDQSIDLILRIYNSRKDTNAVLILGPKRNGRPYHYADMKYLRAVAKSLSIAFENSINYEKVINFNQTLMDEVKRATNSLKKTNHQLKKLDEDKNEFLSMAAHQLKPQLAAARGFNELLRTGAIEEEQRQLLNSSSVSIERMVRIVTDMLNLSRFGTSRVELNKTVINLSAIVSQEVERLVPSIANKQQFLITNIEPDIQISMDEVKTRETIMNFIDNAIFYTPSSGRIYIDLVAENEEAVFSVQDGGIGVPGNEQKKLFNKFYRARNAKEDRPSGTGVGLFMAKKFITAHKGRIVFSSQENIGSIFGFKIPFGEA